MKGLSRRRSSSPRPPSSGSTHRPPNSPPGSPSRPPSPQASQLHTSGEPTSEWTVAQLKGYITRRGGSCEGLLEKAELLAQAADIHTSAGSAPPYTAQEAGAHGEAPPPPLPRSSVRPCPCSNLKLTGGGYQLPGHAPPLLPMAPGPLQPPRRSCPSRHVNTLGRRTSTPSRSSRGWLPSGRQAWRRPLRWTTGLRL